MPVYDYDCAACGRRFEVIHGVHAEGPTTCPLCGKGPVRKAISAAAVHYRGSGWAKKERRTAAAAKSGGDSSASDGTRVDASADDTSKPSGDAEAPTKQTDAPAATGAPNKRAADAPAPASNKRTD
jgi:putative FmdB family regulatory protein